MQVFMSSERSAVARNNASSFFPLGTSQPKPNIAVSAAIQPAVAGTKKLAARVSLSDSDLPLFQRRNAHSNACSLERSAPGDRVTPAKVRRTSRVSYSRASFPAISVDADRKLTHL